MISAFADGIPQPRGGVQISRERRKYKYASICNYFNHTKQTNKMAQLQTKNVQCTDGNHKLSGKSKNEHVKSKVEDDIFTSAPKEDCPICLVRLPIDNGDTIYLSCCGKTVCSGCPHANKCMLKKEMDKLVTSADAEEPTTSTHPVAHQCLTKESSYPCPFCRRALPTSDEEIISVLRKRMDLQDPHAYFNMAGYVREGLHGLAKDEHEAVSLLHQAAELGSAEACSDLFLCYLLGLCGVQPDADRARSLLIQAAKGGLAQARHNLAVLDYEAGRIDDAIRHLKISTAAGYQLSLESMEELRQEGHVSEEEYSRAVEDVLCAQKEEYTEERAEAKKERDAQILQE